MSDRNLGLTAAEFSLLEIAIAAAREEGREEGRKLERADVVAFLRDQAGTQRANTIARGEHVGAASTKPDSEGDGE